MQTSKVLTLLDLICGHLEPSNNLWPPTIPSSWQHKCHCSFHSKTSDLVM